MSEERDSFRLIDTNETINPFGYGNLDILGVYKMTKPKI